MSNEILRMHKKITTYLAALFILISSACADRSAIEKIIIHDTVYIETQVNEKPHAVHELKGTTVLNSSEKNMSSRWLNGLWLDGLKSSECLSQQSETPSPTQITSAKQINDSTLIITASINENCSYSFLGEIEVVANNTLNLIYHGYGRYANCNCSFALTYKIKIFRDSDYNLSNLKYVTINGIAKTSLAKLK